MNAWRIFVVPILALVLLVGREANPAERLVQVDAGMGRLVLNVPAGKWPDVHLDATGPVNGVTERTIVIADKSKPNAEADVGIVSAPDDNRLGSLEDWILELELPSFVEFYGAGDQLVEVSRRVYDANIASLGAAKRVDLVYQGPTGLKGNVAILAFKDPKGGYRHALFVYNVGIFADVKPTLAMIVSHLSWK